MESLYVVILHGAFASENLVRLCLETRQHITGASGFQCPYQVLAKDVSAAGDVRKRTFPQHLSGIHSHREQFFA